MKRFSEIFLIILISLVFGCALSKKKPDTESKPSDATPKLQRPEVRKVWVPDQIVGDEYISGHWKFIIQKNSVWTKQE